MTLAAAVPIKTNRLQSTVGKEDMKNMAEEAQNLLKPRIKFVKRLPQIRVFPNSILIF